MTPDNKNENMTPASVELTDDDIYEAMSSVPGYLDITPGDFRELYCFAYQRAVERISRSMLARDIMVKEVVSVRPETPIPEVAEIMGSRNVSGVPVVDGDGRVVGVISEKDFLARMGAEGARSFMAAVAICLRSKGCVALPIKVQNAKDIMTCPAITVGEDASYQEIAQIFTEKGVNRVPVVDEQGRLVGIVSRADIVRAAHTTSCGIVNP